MAVNSLIQECDPCCPCGNDALCDCLGARVGPALWTNGDGGNLPNEIMPDPDSTACCFTARPNIWWATPPAALIAELEGGEDLVYEIWREDVPDHPEDEYCPEPLNNDVLLSSECSLVTYVTEVVGVDHEYFQSQEGADPDYIGPILTRAEWLGTSAKCCRRWPNFFIKVIARGDTDRHLTTCNVLWDIGEAVGPAPELGWIGDLCVSVGGQVAPCKCGYVEETFRCPEIDPVPFEITVEATNVTFTFTLVPQIGTEGYCDCGLRLYRGDIGDGCSASASMCLEDDGFFHLSISASQTIEGEPVTTLSLEAFGGECPYASGGPDYLDASIYTVSPAFVLADSTCDGVWIDGETPIITVTTT